MELTAILAARAFRLASVRFKSDLRRGDWELLGSLYCAKKAVSFNYLYKDFNPTSRASYVKGNSWFYKHAEILVRAGYINETRTRQGWRRWQITTAGIAAIHRLNEEAMKFLEEAV